MVYVSECIHLNEPVLVLGHLIAVELRAPCLLDAYAQVSVCQALAARSRQWHLIPTGSSLQGQLASWHVHACRQASSPTTSPAGQRALAYK
jgi:hypothetical protein